jgi:hypothetical protein
MERYPPTAELVIRDGMPVWLIQGGGVETTHNDLQRAMLLFRQEATASGLSFPAGADRPERGPSECDEPGV